jgi:hypothetical protein
MRQETGGENGEEGPVRRCGPVNTDHFQVAPWYHPFGDTEGESFSLSNEKGKKKDN